MRTLTAREIIQAWEWGQDRHPLDRGLLLLSLATPEMSLDQIAALTVGQRNLRLLDLRSMTLGPAFEASARCPQCAAPLVFSVQIADIRRHEPEGREFTLTAEGYRVDFRLPTSLDLAGIAGLGLVDAARSLLVERCVLGARQGDQAIVPADLPDSLVAALAEAVQEQDPQAETRFKISCTDCGHSWSAIFDISSFFWAEIEALAKRLLQDVATLARSFGFSETEILAMSALRRRHYLELAN